MKDDFSKVPPGFKMFHAFFADLKEPFTSIRLTEKKKAFFLNKLLHLNGEPEEAFQDLSEDLELTAEVCEARKYADGNTFSTVRVPSF